MSRGAPTVAISSEEATNFRDVMRVMSISDLSSEKSPISANTPSTLSEADEPPKSHFPQAFAVENLVSRTTPSQIAMRSPVVQTRVKRIVVAPPAPKRIVSEPIMPIVSLPPAVPPVQLPSQVGYRIPNPIVMPKNVRANPDDLIPPPPSFYRDARNGEYGLRCVCGEAHTTDGMVECDKCDFWLHNMCVNIARTGKNEPYICPFCANQKIRCLCGKNMKYDEPLIQCAICGNWSHKECENLDFGANPARFVCRKCGGTGEYELKYVTFDRDDRSVPDTVVSVNCDRTRLLESLPEGPFKVLVMSDLDKGQLSFRETVTKYFHAFAHLLFDRSHEFWRTCCDTLCTLLNCERPVIMNAFDVLATKLLYRKASTNRGVERIDEFRNSEAIDGYLGTLQIPRLETEPHSIRLQKTVDGRVTTPVQIDDGGFICEVPGFLIHTDEVKADDGIPLNSILVTDNEVVLDTEGSTFELAANIKRSFHFNCILKLVKINDQLKVALYAVRLKGPLSEEKSRRGPAIPASGELFLPFDGDIPYPVRKCEWKERKQRTRIAPPEKKPKPVKTERMTRRKSIEPIVREHQYKDGELTLLSSFLDSSAPPAPFVILPDEETVEQYKIQREIRTRVRSSRSRPRYDE